MNQEAKWLLSEKYGGAESEAFRADLKRLAEGEPLAYVIGHVPFLDCQIHLDSHPLIPRPETEYWALKAILSIRMDSRSVRVLDLCAGSGCIGVAVAKAIPEAQVTFGEIDPSHLPTIEANLKINLNQNQTFHSNERFEVVQSDLFENIKGKFDFILTNPPYIDPTIDRAEKSVKDYEPHLALYGGHDGLEIIYSIIDDSINFLAPQGQLWIEHEPEQAEEILKLAGGAGYARATTFPDQYGVLRYSVLVK